MKILRHRINEILLGCGGCWLVLTTYAFGQNYPEFLPVEQRSAVTVALTTKEVVLSYSVLIFGLIVLLAQVYLLRLVKANPQHILLTFTVNTIIVSSLYLITVGLSSDQIAPAFSLYGAIVGYLLGQESGRNESVISSKSQSEDN